MKNAPRALLEFSKRPNAQDRSSSPQLQGALFYRFEISLSSTSTPAERKLIASA